MSPGLAHWHAAFARQLTLDDVMLMASQPRFADATRMTMALGLSRHGQFPRLSRALRDVRSFASGFLILYLHAQGGMTLSRMRELSAQESLASRGRAAAILDVLRHMDFVRPDPEHTDKRERRYLPTPRLEDAMRSLLLGGVHALALVEPAAAAAADRLANPEFFRAFVLKAGETLLRSGEIMLSLRVGLLANTFFGARDRGLAMLHDMVLSAQPDDVFPPSGPLKMSVRDLARRYGVSRAHVFRMFTDAENFKLLVRDADTQTGTLTEETRIGITTASAAALIGLAECCVHAANETAATATVGEAVDRVASG